MTGEATKAPAKSTADRRVFAEIAVWRRCSALTDRCGDARSSRLALRPFPRKLDPSNFQAAAKKLKRRVLDFRHGGAIVAGKEAVA